ncbi:TetR family transcriptional regulator C-terminal domain-containing protein [Streptomyces olivaceus]|uniref:TetR family transcriptional regulator C-terminal domain-containing protein n=1 Tax=Streptomyces olivaceus TaxID=47716 RepID=UPI00368C000B
MRTCYLDSDTCSPEEFTLPKDLQTVPATGNAVTAGELHSEADIHEIAVTIAAVMDGLQLQWTLAPDTFDMPGHLRRILDAMYAGIKA